MRSETRDRDSPRGHARTPAPTRSARGTRQRSTQPSRAGRFTCSCRATTARPSQGTGGALVLHDSGLSHDITEGLSASITNGNATTLITASETLFGSNGGDGIHLTGGANHLFSLRGCRINQNVGDGIEVDANWTLNIMDNMFASNGVNCINNAAATPVTCQPGLNQFVPIPAACMVFPAACGLGAGAPLNQ